MQRSAPDLVRADAPSSPRKHIPELDGMRGLAVLLVFFLHFAMWQHQTAACTIDRLYAYASETGWIGVDLFFVLSGFLITGILLKAREDAGYFRNFYGRRLLRIFPLYYGVLALLFLVLPNIHAAPAELKIGGLNQWSYWLFVSNFTMHLDPTFSHARGLTWSLAIEEQFYLVWPAVVWLCSRQGTLVAAIGLLLTSIGLRAAMPMLQIDPVHDYFWTFTHMDGLAVGAMLAVGLSASIAIQSKLHRWAWPAISAGLAGMALAEAASIVRHVPMHHDPIGQLWLYPSVTLVAAGLLLQCVKGSGPLAGLFRTRPLRFFGKYSYGLYLLQGFAQVIVLHLPLPDLHIGHSRLPAQAMFFAANLGVTVALALLSWNLLERHCLSLKHVFSTSSPYRVAAERPAQRPVFFEEELENASFA